MTKVFKAGDIARMFSANSSIGDWSLATAKIINGKTGNLFDRASEARL